MSSNLDIDHSIGRERWVPFKVGEVSVPHYISNYARLRKRINGKMIDIKLTKTQMGICSVNYRQAKKRPKNKA